MLRNRTSSLSRASEAAPGLYRHHGLCADTAEVWGEHLYITVAGSAALHRDNPRLRTLQRNRGSQPAVNTLQKAIKVVKQK